MSKFACVEDPLGLIGKDSQENANTGATKTMRAVCNKITQSL